MEITEFKSSIGQESMPEGLSLHMQALWYDKKGQWHKAHSLIDSLGDEDSAYLHAYLHRREGDLSNAEYWYRRAGKKRPAKSLDEEWEDMVHYFLAKK